MANALPSVCSLPQILCAAKFEDQSSKKDERILEKNSNSWVHHCFLFNDVSSKQNPHGSNQRAKSHHKANEEPDPSTCLSQAAFAVTVTPHLSMCFSRNGRRPVSSFERRHSFFAFATFSASMGGTSS